MNNNRGNNRRRGRGNNNRPQGGGQQVNRIDSRARGNAPQLLEKYRKLAHDAHLNGDRVTEEYNLQFADHYFRVIADTRQRQEEQRTRRDDRWQEGGTEGYREESDDAGDFNVESEYGSYEQSVYGNGSGNSSAGGNGNSSGGGNANSGGGNASSGNTGSGNNNRREREERPRREERAEQESRPEPEPQVEESAEEQHDQRDQASPYEPPENPFVREARPSRGLRARRPRREENAEARSGDASSDEGDVAPSIDPSMLPPSISAGREEAPAADEAAEAKPRRRTRRKPSADDALEPVG